MKLLILFFLLISFKISFSQNVKFVEENTLESVKYAPVFVKTSKQWYLTDSIGVINFPKSTSPMVISIKAMGYEEQEVKISSNRVIYLKRSFQVLNDVVVKPRRYLAKKFVTKNGKLFYGYTFNWTGNFIGFGTIVNFKDSLNWLNKITFSAQIDGDKNSKLVRFRLYRFTEDISEWNHSKPFNNGFEEIYNYQLKNIFSIPKSKWLTFNIPPGIILESGNYLISFEMIPNQKDKLKVWYSSDSFVHSYYNKKSNYWVKEIFGPKGGYYNMRVNIDYDTN